MGESPDWGAMMTKEAHEEAHEDANLPKRVESLEELVVVQRDLFESFHNRISALEDQINEQQAGRGVLVKVNKALTKRMEKLDASNKDEREALLEEIRQAYKQMSDGLKTSITDNLTPFVKMVSKSMKAFSIRLVVTEERAKLLQKVATGFDSEDVPDEKGN